LYRLSTHPTGRLARHALAAAALALAGCSSGDGLLSGDKVDYRSTNTAKSKPLDVPPDLTQLARENRYATQGGVVSAAGVPAAAAANVTTSAQPVAVQSLGTVKVERAGTQRWLVAAIAPEQLWPLVKTFWQERGFTIAFENAEAGIMETDWSENRTKLPNDLIRGTLGRVFSGLYDSGERDRYRTRIERTPTGSEVYISHRGLEEVYTNESKDAAVWRPRAADPSLEAEFLTRLMARLGTPEASARTAVATAPETPSRARAIAGAASAALEVDEPFDRAWRRVGLALDRGGFTVEDRDRAGGLYFVRYIDPKNAGKDDPGWWERLFSKSDQTRGTLRYRIAVKASGEKTTVAVLTSTGAPETGENGKRIVGQLVNELR
jgi:outer membrane protein assembly factor BamC